MEIPFIKRLAAYFIPIKIKESKGVNTPLIKLYYYCGRWQLAADQVLYSDGKHYLPIKKAFSYLKKESINFKTLLVLGGGLASVLDLIERYFSLSTIHSTIVEIDPQILDWAQKVHSDKNLSTTNWVLQDVAEFMSENKKQYELLILDVFHDNHVPRFIFEDSFLENCLRSMAPHSGLLIMNYMIINNEQWTKDQKILFQYFKLKHCIEFGINRVLFLSTY